MIKAGSPSEHRAAVTAQIPTSYTIFTAQTHPNLVQIFTTFDVNQAVSAYGHYCQAQVGKRRESLVALIAGKVLTKATHGEWQVHGNQRGSFAYREYFNLSDSLRSKTAAIWNHPQLRSVR